MQEIFFQVIIVILTGIDNNGQMDIRAAKEGTLKELNKNITYLLTHQAKQRKLKRKKKLKKLENKLQYQEYERILQTYEKPTQDYSRNQKKNVLTLPLINSQIMSPKFPINFSIRRDESFIKESEEDDKELEIKDFMGDTSTIEPLLSEELKKSVNKRLSLAPINLNLQKSLNLQRFVTFKKANFPNILKVPQSKPF